jgi:hypothetical protein
MYVKIYRNEASRINDVKAVSYGQEKYFNEAPEAVLHQQNMP